MSGDFLDGIVVPKCRMAGAAGAAGDKPLTNNREATRVVDRRAMVGTILLNAISRLSGKST